MTIIIIQILRTKVRQDKLFLIKSYFLSINFISIFINLFLNNLLLSHYIGPISYVNYIVDRRKKKDAINSNEEPSSSSIPIFTTHDNKKVAISDAQLYLQRNFRPTNDIINNHDLSCLSHNEWKCCCKIAPLSNAEHTHLSTMNGILRVPGQPGRPPSLKMLLSVNSPLHFSHCMVLKSLQTINIYAEGKSPVYPVEQPTPGCLPSDVLQKNRDSWGSYVVANHWPISEDEKMPFELNWKGFCDMMQYIDNFPTFINLGRKQLIINLAHGTRTNPIHGEKNKKLITQFRNSNAENVRDVLNVDPFSSVRLNRMDDSLNNTTNDLNDIEAMEEIRLNNEARLRAQLIHDLNRIDSRSDERALNAYSTRNEFIDNLETITNNLFSNDVNYSHNISTPLDETSIREKIFQSRDIEIHVLDTIRSNLTKNVPIFHSNNTSNNITLSSIQSRPNSLLNINDNSNHSHDIHNEDNDPIFHNLKEGQKKIIRYVNENIVDGELRPMKILILGAPGTGKTYTVSRIHTILEKINISLPKVAMTGSAATNLKGGMTVHNFFGFSISGPQSLSSEKSIPSLKLQNVKKLILKQKLGNNSCIVLDEISLSTTRIINHISERIKDTRDDENDSTRTLRNLPFGNHSVILLGDYNQTPPIGGTSIYDFIYKFLCEPEKLKTPRDDLMIEGFKLYKSFKRFKLLEQNRSDDPTHSLHISNYINVNNIKPISIALINTFRSKILNKTDISNNKEWLFATILTSSNIEREFLNNYKSIYFAKYFNHIRVTWDLNIKGSFVDSLTNDELNNLKKSNHGIEMIGTFIHNAPCALNTNICPEKCMANGSVGTMHSIKFDVNDPLYYITINMINEAMPGETVHIPLAPVYIFVEIDLQHGLIIPDSEKIPIDVAIPSRENTVIIAVKNDGKKKKKKFVNNCVVGNRIGDVICDTPIVDLLFACTFEKSQGKTLKLVVLCLHENPYKSPKPHDVFVGMSRVTNGNNYRIYPYNNDTLDRFKDMERNKNIVHLEEAYNHSGYFSDELYKESVKRHNTSNKVKRTGNKIGSGRRKITRTVEINNTGTFIRFFFFFL